MTNKRAISASYLKVIFDALKDKGIDTDALRKKAGIDEQLVHSTDAFLDACQYQRLISTLLKQADDPCLGLYIGQFFEVGTHGILSYAALGMPTVWECLKLGEEFARIRSPSLQVALALEDEHAVISFDTSEFEAEVYQFIIEGAICAYYAILNLVFDNEVPITSIAVRYPAPDDIETYQKTLGYPLVFNSAKNEIRLPRACVEKTLETANPFIAKELQKHIHEQVAAMEEASLKQKTHVLLGNVLNTLPTQEFIAAQLNLSPRTLRRQLKEEGVSFQQVINEHRRDQAIDQLLHSDLSIEEIAFLMGFSSASHFSYAFKQWTGSAPKFYRQKHRDL